MAKLSGGLNREVLSAALEGLEAQKRKIDEQLLQVRSMLGLSSGRRGRPPKTSSAIGEDSGAPPRRRRRKLSAEARARISAAQKKRWAATKR